MSNCKVIVLTKQKGGVGKTTTAVCLGIPSFRLYTKYWTDPVSS